MHRLIGALILALTLPVGAETTLYKWKDADGTVHFSDQPHPGAEEVTVQEVPTIPAPRLPPSAPASARPAAVSYDNVTITNPANDSTLRDNAGNISVTVAVTPLLRADLGHKVLLDLDGQPQGEGISFSLTNVERGSHTLTATVIDKDGAPLISGSSTFHLLRFSALLNPGDSKNPPAKP